jgi:serpin B
MITSQGASTATEIYAPAGSDTAQAVATESASGALIVAYNRCGQQLFRAFSKEPGNIVLSPYSIGTAMTMMLAGARGETASEMAKVLGLQLSREMIDGANAAALGSLRKIPSARSQMYIANALMLTKRGTIISEDYVSLLRKTYAAEIFRGTDLAKVNGWVKEKTGGKIDSIANRFDQKTALVLLDAIYFKARWRQAFDAHTTKNEPFHRPGGEIQVPMMHVLSDFAVVERSGYRAIRLPFASADVAMIVMLPNADIADVVGLLDDDEMQSLLGAFRTAPQPVSLSLPRFHAHFEASLVEPFIAIGMRLPFDAALADFSGITGMPPSVVPLQIDQIMHRAVIDVAEEGAEAAAVTSVEVKIISAMPQSVNIFRIDRPFAFAIVDQKTGAVLFEGQVVDPR